MRNKLIKYSLRAILGIACFLLLVAVAVYLPPVQNFIKNKAVSYVTDNLGLDLSVEKLRIKFPLRLTLDNTLLSVPQGDTIARVEHVSVEVALLPLLRSELRTSGFTITNAAMHYRDSSGSVDIRAQWEELGLNPLRLGIRNKKISAGQLGLKGAVVRLTTAQSNVPDTSSQTETVWKIDVVGINLERVDFEMRMEQNGASLLALLAEAELDNCTVDLGAQEIDVASVRLVDGDYAYYTGTSEDDQLEESPEAQDSQPWEIRVGQIEIENNSFRFGQEDGTPRPGFDPSHIYATEIDISIDSAYNRGSEVSGDIRKLSLTERSGLRITDTRGFFRVDSAGMSLNNFILTTEGSQIMADASIISSDKSFGPSAAIDANLEADVSGDELMLFYRPDAALRQTLAGRNLTVDGQFGGSLSDIDITRLHLSLPGYINLTADGRLRSLTDPSLLGGDLRFDGNFTNLRFLKSFIPDTTMRNRISFPDRLGVSGTFAFGGNVYVPDVRITADSGDMSVKGRLDLPSQIYNAEIAAEDFPLYRFLPRDSLGLASLHLLARGQGFDPRQPGASALVNLDIVRFDYMGHSYTDLSADVSVADHAANGSITGRDPAAQFYIGFDGVIRPDHYAARLIGDIDLLDLYALNLSASPFSLAAILDAEASANFGADTVYMAQAVMDSTLIAHGNRREFVDRISLEAHADRDSVTAAVRSGDLSLDFIAPVSLPYLTSGLSRAVSMVGRQIDSASVNMTVIQEVLPPFNLRVTAGDDNALHQLISDNNLSFEQLSVSAATDSARPFHAWVVVNGFHSGNITLDTLNVGLRQKEESLEYFVRLANRPGNIDQLALLAVYGSMEGNEAKANFYQRDRSDSVGFRFGLDITLQDSSLRASVFPENPVFGYENWTVNPGNYVEYDYGRELDADVRLTGDGKHVYITSAAMPSLPTGAINLDMRGIDISNTLRLLPSAPEISGTLFSDVTAGLDGDLIAVKGEIGVDGFRYKESTVGNLALDVDFQADSIRQRLLDATLSVNDTTAFTAKGVYIHEGDKSMSFEADMPMFPLYLANAFIPEEAARLSGYLRGHLEVAGTPRSPEITGEIAFSDTQVRVAAIGTSFRMPADPITISDNRINFNQYSILSPRNSPLTLDGEIDFSDLSRLYADLELYATNFDAVNSTRNAGSMVYGTALLDIDITARGPMDAMILRGDIDILNGTDVTYTLTSSDLDVQSQQQDIVTFVDFSDSTALAVLDSLAPRRIWGLDMLVNVDIADGVEATVNLSADGNNRVELVGQGILTYTSNSQGDNRFTGRYELSGGTVVYYPPIISPARFAINDGSYVEWTGDIANPTFHITATETRKTNVSIAGGNSSNVDFNIIIRVENTLEDLQLTFDLEAPGDITIQNQLASLAPEQRSTQAIALLVYNTYTGPGTTAKVDVNNPLNTFIEKELNQWARNNFKDVDVSFGINSVDDAVTGSQHTDYSYKVSKSLFDDRVKVTVGGSINSDESTQDNLANNVVDDISLEYRLTQRDNMFLKAYRYNTQESILEGEVVETGVGFVVRKKLNKITDLFRFTRIPEKKEARARRKEIKQQFREAEEARGEDPAKEQRQPEPGLSKAVKTEEELEYYD